MITNPTPGRRVRILDGGPGYPGKLATIRELTTPGGSLVLLDVDNPPSPEERRCSDPNGGTWDTASLQYVDTEPDLYEDLSAKIRRLGDANLELREQREEAKARVDELARDLSVIHAEHEALTAQLREAHLMLNDVATRVPDFDTVESVGLDGTLIENDGVPHTWEDVALAAIARLAAAERERDEARRTLDGCETVLNYARSFLDSEYRAQVEGFIDGRNSR